MDLGPEIGSDYLACIKHAAEINGGRLALEFGVASGRTLSWLSQHGPVVGFDSFDGLPEDWREGFPKGTFATEIPDVPNATLVVGLFENTVEKWASENTESVGLVHIDCDLYSSTRTALWGVQPLLRSGTLIVFDEYHGYPGWEEHEAKAWAEFVDEFDIDFIILGHGPEQLLIEIV